MAQNTSSTVEAKDCHVDPTVATPPQKKFKFFDKFNPFNILKGDRNPSSLPPSKARAAALDSSSTPVVIDELTTDDTIIALMGPTGSGKSSFINMLTEHYAIVGHDLESCTAEVSMVRIDDVILVDTPGFDDTNKTDREILTMIADWLTNTYQREIKLAGILYFHRITDNRVAGTPLKNLRMFEKLCGKHALGNIILTTTMWDKIDEAIGQEREKELRGLYWKSMIKLGSTTVRYRNTKDSAWEILDTVLQSGHNRHAVLLQKEMVEMKRQLNETEAGRTLYTALELLVKRRQEALDEIQAASTGQTDQELLKRLQDECDEIQRQLDITIADLLKMQISVGKRFRRFFTSPHWFLHYL